MVQPVTTKKLFNAYRFQSQEFIYKFFFKWAIHGLFFIYFGAFQTNNTLFTTNQCDKCPSSIWF